jgi:hypothetical protein
MKKLLFDLYLFCKDARHCLCYDFVRYNWNRTNQGNCSFLFLIYQPFGFNFLSLSKP